MPKEATSEDSGYSASELLSTNKPYVRSDAKDFNTDLGVKEPDFQKWVTTNEIPFDSTDKTPDYDMRGYWQALQSKDPRAVTALNPNDQKTHFPDFWKTPYGRTFSAESQWANPATAPNWNAQDQLVTPDGKVVFDDKKQAVLNLMHAIVSHPQFMQMLELQIAGQK